MASRKARDPHPEEELRALAAHLKQGTARGYVMKGEERYYRERAAKLVIQAATALEYEICRHDVKDPDFEPARLADDLTGGALFADARCIVVHNVDPLLKKTGKRYAPAVIEAVRARLASQEPGTLVLAAESLRADNVLVKAVKQAGGVVVTCRRLWDTPPPWDPDPRKAELVQWLVARSRGRGVPLTDDEAAYVAAATGNDLYALDAQLETLAKRGKETIRELVGWEAGGSPFVVAEHLVSGDAPRAVTGIEAMFGAGFQGRDGSRLRDRAGLATMLVNAITGKVREALAGATALEGGDTMDGAAQLAGVRGGPPRQAFEARVRSRAAAEWRGLLAEVGDLERRSRTGARVDANDFALLALRWAKRREAARGRR